jgi:hypothetical protein
MITWTNRYSDTMEDDKFGRWARVACIGEGLNSMEVAWVRKFTSQDNPEDKFYIQRLFPSNGYTIFKTLEEAKEQVRIDLEHFKTLLK